MAKRPDWQEAFLTTTNRVCFELKLTRPMMEMLCAATDNVRWDRSRYGGLLYPDCWIGTEHALIRRGLITRRIELAQRKPVDAWPWKLTPVGEAVVEMLRVGGLFIAAEEAKQKMTARKGRN